MKKLMFLALLAAGAVAARAATCYSVPEEYRSGLWEASVDGRPNGVASARTCDPPFDKRYDFGGEYAFTSFEMDAPAKVTVRPKTARDMDRVRILPASAPVTMRTLPDGALELAVARPCRFATRCSCSRTRPSGTCRTRGIPRSRCSVRASTRAA